MELTNKEIHDAVTGARDIMIRQREKYDDMFRESRNCLSKFLDGNFVKKPARTEIVVGEIRVIWKKRYDYGNKMRIIHISDLHFHRNKNDNTEITKTLKNIRHGYPESYVVVTGDITDDGHPQQYENALDALRMFEDRIFVAPGNHDYGAIGNFYSRERAKRFDEMLSIPLNQGGTFSGENKPVVNIVRDGESKIMFIALDSNLETEVPFDFACGEIGETQLRTLDLILKNEHTSTIIILFFHHHPFMMNDPFMHLRDAKNLARIVYGRVDFILFGHRHKREMWRDKWGTSIMAADDTPGKRTVGEILIRNGEMSMSYIPAEELAT